MAKFLQKAIEKRRQALINLLLTTEKHSFNRKELEQLTLSEIEELMRNKQ